MWHSVYGHVIKYLRYSHHCFTFTFLVGSSKKDCDTTSVQSVDHPTDITNKHQPSRSLLSLLPKEPQQVILKLAEWCSTSVVSTSTWLPSIVGAGNLNLAQFNSLACGRCWCNLWLIISHIKGRYVEHFLWNCHHVNATKPRWWLVTIDSGNGLVPPGAIVDPDICHQMASLGQNELKLWYLQCISNGDTTIWYQLFKFHSFAGRETLNFLALARAG